MSTEERLLRLKIEWHMYKQLHIQWRNYGTSVGAIFSHDDFQSRNYLLHYWRWHGSGIEMSGAD
jgi:hypothetical protein